MILEEIFIRMLNVFQYLLVGILLILSSITLPLWLRFSAKGSDGGYQMKREMLSPVYTINFDELPVARA
ncbi:DUF4113 domain-containing protein [Providencia alcalifaciens]|uniref:DUF4113 domain-containing protein n=1 Tax=Providencia alcalifaciens TaxID=126385 RepID=UPI002B05A99B|nr:DUF4113 domain-containing protein [Providencia alcalifaciens]